MRSYRKLQKLIEDIEKEYSYPAKDQIEWFRRFPLRWLDIAEILGCSRKALRKVCRLVEVEESSKVIFRAKRLPRNATDFLKSFETIEDAVVECRSKRRWTVSKTALLLGICESTVIKHTPDWLRGIYNMSEEGLKIKQEVGRRAKPNNHPWKLGKF